MIGESKKIAVVYLSWLPYGIKHFRSFLESYLLHSPGWNHELIIAFNGTELSHPNPPEIFLSELQAKKNVTYRVLYFPKGQDIEIYAKIAAQLEHDYILYLNTYSVILGNNWLKNYAENWGSHTGAIAASGSWQSYFSSVFSLHSIRKEKDETLPKYFRKIKLLIKASIYWRFLFNAFPNPHIRTNAFFVERTVFTDITKRLIIRNKMDAYRFENGKKGLTKLLEKLGKEVLVVNKQGDIFPKNDWHLSFTFRKGNQENLLISDNQTREYQQANAETKIQLSKLSWGKYA